MLAQPKKVQYFPISPLLLRSGDRGAFDVFLRRDNAYVLFNAYGGVLTEAKRRELIDNDVKQVYVDKRSLDRYHAFILENIASLLDDEDVPIDERAQAWTGAAVALSKGVFEQQLPGPAFEKRYERFETLIRNTSSFLQSAKSLKHLSKFISKGYDIYHHGISTMVYTVNLMQEYDYDDYKVLTCGMGALLHDIGKMKLPKELVGQNPAELSDDDKSILAVHPMLGARTCASFNLPTLAANCILFHHERADGKGYPTQAMGDEVPTHTKIVSLCNRYDGLTRNMPYRKAYTPFEALKIIMEDKGFVEKDILKRFLEMLSKATIV